MNPVNEVFQKLDAYFKPDPVSKERIEEIRDELEDVPTSNKNMSTAEIIYYEQGGEID